MSEIDDATRALAIRWLDDLATATDHPASEYGDAFADVYDAWYPDRGDAAAAVAFLAELATSMADIVSVTGPLVLELGAGTGRLALPLAERLGPGSVMALDASAAMLDRLRGKPGSERVAVVCGDMAGVLPPGPFTLVVVATNTLFNLAESGAQERCVAAIAERLVPGGRFVVEAFVPDDTAGDGDHLSRSGGARRSSVGDVLTASRTDVAEQQVIGGHLDIVDGLVLQARPWKMRWKSPAQIDALCANVGLQLERRVSDWSRSPFDGESVEHVSVYRRATA